MKQGRQHHPISPVFPGAVIISPWGSLISVAWRTVITSTWAVISSARGAVITSATTVITSALRTVISPAWAVVTAAWTVVTPPGWAAAIDTCSRTTGVRNPAPGTCRPARGCIFLLLHKSKCSQCKMQGCQGFQLAPLKSTRIHVTCVPCHLCSCNPLQDAPLHCTHSTCTQSSQGCMSEQQGSPASCCWHQGHGLDQQCRFLHALFCTARSATQADWACREDRHTHLDLCMLLFLQLLLCHLLIIALQKAHTRMHSAASSALHAHNRAVSHAAAVTAVLSAAR